VTPRTAVGTLADGKLVIVSTSAASIQQMRELMLQLGCTDAINLDGGASTALAYQGQIVRNAGRQLTTTLQVFVK
jgi:exopolysaccharide biosynthesis protein